jgi:glycine cleavage system T protein (aminomethyltransferase)
MVRTTPFHERTSALNETGLWEHWSNHLVATRYQASDKAEYVAIRNSAGLFDTSPLFKYRIHGPDAARFLAGVLTRDPRRCPVGRAQYTLWCDDRGFVVEDGVLLHVAEDEYLLTAVGPNLAWFEGFRGRLAVEIEDVSDDWAILAIQGPRSRELVSAVAPEAAGLPYFGLERTTVAGADAIVSRTGYTGDLGYEIWAPAEAALAVWDAVSAAGADRGVVPFGMTALYMARIEAGLVLLDVEYRSARFAWTDADRSTPVELGLAWTVAGLGSDRDDGRAFVGGEAIRRELASRSSRWRLTGLVVDWEAHARVHRDAGLLPPKDHTPIHDEYYVYDDALRQIGYATSQLYSPLLQRHVALARVPLDREPGATVKLEIPVAHRYEHVDAEVTALPLFDPPRRRA